MQSKMTAHVANPTHCEHDEFRVYPNVPKENFTAEELAQLDVWGFFWDDEFDEGFMSFRFGSC
jgi:hypothetical protein